MMITTKGRYALRVMIDIAENSHGAYITLADIAKRQEISEKYLESIVAVLSKNNFLNALRGKGGGYTLSREPGQYTVGDILKLTEGSLATVACLKNQPNTCTFAPKCRTIGMWSKLDKMVDDFFEGITLADLMQGDIADLAVDQQ